MLTRVFKGWPSMPNSDTLLGRMSTTLSTWPDTVSASVGCFLSLVCTPTFSMILLPPYPLVETVTVIFPSPPGGICLSLEAAVHPQPLLSLMISSGAVPLFCKIKSCTTLVPSATGSN